MGKSSRLSHPFESGTPLEAERDTLRCMAIKRFVDGRRRSRCCKVVVVVVVSRSSSERNVVVLPSSLWSSLWWSSFMN